MSAQSKPKVGLPPNRRMRHDRRTCRVGQATSVTGSYTHSVGNNFSTGVSATRSWQGGQTTDQVRATLTWRF